MQKQIVHITGMTDDGRGVARHEGKVYFVARALPGQTVEIAILHAKKRFVEAEQLRIVTDMPDALPAFCPHAEACGGCPLQTMPYTRQLQWKEQLIKDALRRIGGLPEAPVASVLPSPLLRAFRNKMEFAFGTGQDGALLLGLRRRASREVLDVTDCALLPEMGMHLLDAIRQLARSSGFAAYLWPHDDTRNEMSPFAIRQHGKEHLQHLRRQDKRVVHAEGLWRFAILRQGLDAYGCPGWWVRIVTSRASAAAHQAVRHMGECLLAQFPAVKGFVHEIRQRKDMLTQGEERVLTLGPCGAEIMAELHGKFLRLDIGSFFQVNTEASRTLCREIMLMAQNSAEWKPTLARGTGPVLWDLYCGSGAPGLALAGAYSTLLGIEYDATAVRHACENATAWKFSHCTYLTGDAGATLTRLEKKDSLPAPDMILIDPPRAGMDAVVTACIIRAAPRRILYVSCNPATLARDIGVLHTAGFQLRQVQPVDLFPHTPHVECVALLEGHL